MSTTITLTELSSDLLANNLRRLSQDIGINEAELARRTKVPQPTLHKILSGETEDPRVSTLKELADFFSTTIDDLLTGTTSIARLKRLYSPEVHQVPIISWEECLDATSVIAELSPGNWSKWVVSTAAGKGSYALYSKPSMEPSFQKDTILVIQPDLKPKDGDLLIVHYPDIQEAALRRLLLDGPVKLLLSVSAKDHCDRLVEGIFILGVVVQSIYSYHNP
jgi:transcriptional regulator with XRE-family HTH domain